MDVWVLCGWELGEGETILGVFDSEKDAYIAMKMHFESENKYGFLDYVCYQIEVGKLEGTQIRTWWDSKYFDELDKKYLEI